MVVFWGGRRRDRAIGDVVEDGVQVVQHSKLLCYFYCSFQRNPRTLIFTVAPLHFFVDACLDVFLQDSCPLCLGEVGDLQDVGCVDPPVFLPPHHRRLGMDELVHRNSRVRCGIQIFVYHGVVLF